MPPPLDLLPDLVGGLVVTIEVTAGAAVVALVMAFAAGLSRLAAARVVRAAATAYVEVFRGTSALVQLFWVYFVLPLLGVSLDPMTAGILVLGLNIGAYGAEVVRGAILAVPRSQREAAAALGFTPRQTRWRVVVPQALPVIVPPAGNLLIELLKGTALVSLITLGDLTFAAQTLRASTLRTAEIFTLVLVIYFLVAAVLTAGMRWIERHVSAWRQPDRGASRA
jgi:polar amino acid transport system permease protein